MSPEEVAHNWAMKQQQEQYQKDWMQFERDLEPVPEELRIESAEAWRGVEVPQQRVCGRLWKAPIETNQKKASKWRARMRAQLRVSEQDPLLQDAEAGCHASVRSQSDVTVCNTITSNAGGEVPGKPRRAARASRRSKLMSVYTLNTSGRPAAITALSKLAKKAKGIAAVAIQ
jgi:hypothetical protein